MPDAPPAPAAHVPARGYVVTAAGTAVNLCLGILYAWSVWKATLAPKGVPAGTPMTGPNTGWVTLSESQATWAYAVCGVTFALMMVPGGRLQDRYGPRVGAVLAGLFLAAGCVVAGLARSYLGLVLGFGLLGGVGMGLGYAAATPAAVKWFGPHRRGLVVGLVVAGFGGAAVYIAPLATALIDGYGLTGSFLGLGALFGLVVVAAGLLLRPPPNGYAPPAGPARTGGRRPSFGRDLTTREMLRTPSYYALVGLFAGAAQAGLLIIANATPILAETARDVPGLARNGWLLAAFGGLVNAAGRVGTGGYSDRLGRLNAYALNGLLAAACLLLTPTIIESRNIFLLFIVIGVAFWQYGGTLSLMPALTADYYGPRHLGLNYGCVFLGWGVAFFVPHLAAVVRDATGRGDVPFYLSGGLLVLAVAGSRLVRRPAG